MGEVRKIIFWFGTVLTRTFVETGPPDIEPQEITLGDKLGEGQFGTGEYFLFYFFV